MTSTDCLASPLEIVPDPNGDWVYVTRVRDSGLTKTAVGGFFCQTNLDFEFIENAEAIRQPGGWAAE